MTKLWITTAAIVCVLAGVWGLRFSPISRADLSDDPTAEPLHRLLIGNQRFLRAQSVHQREVRPDLTSLAKAQKPFAVVVTCSDSRVPPELLFDQGFGDLFVIRTAGNVIGALELGSVEYAVEHLGAKLVIVLGHEKCGAVQAYAGHGISPLPGHIENVVGYIRDEEEIKKVRPDAKNYLDLCIEANIFHGVHVLQQDDPILTHATHSGNLTIVGALYDFDTGAVRVLSEKNVPVGNKPHTTASVSH
jgi:carbonic anhydrase